MRALYTINCRPQQFYVRKKKVAGALELESTIPYLRLHWILKGPEDLSDLGLAAAEIVTWADFPWLR
jgi:hypothetical protein